MTIRIVGDRKPRTAAKRDDVNQLDWPLSRTPLSQRTRNMLESIGVFTVRELAQQPRWRLLEIRMFGKHNLRSCVRVVRRAMKGKLEDHRDM